MNRIMFIGMQMVIIALALWIMQTSADAGPPPQNWFQANQDGFVSGFGPSSAGTILFVFDKNLYAYNEDGLFRMEDPIMRDWTHVVPPAPPAGPGANPSNLKPFGQYLYAWDNNQLWWIQKGADLSSNNWNQVTSVGLPGGVSPFPGTMFNGQIYGVYYDGPSGTFEIWRTGDIGATVANWQRVVMNSFGDPINNQGVDIMIVFNGYIYAGTTTLRGNFGDPNYYGTGVEVWESPTGNAGTWTQVNVDGFGTKLQTCSGVPNCAIHQVIGSAAVYHAPGQTQEYLYIGTKSHYGAEIWRYNGTGKSGWLNVTPSWAGPCLLGCGPGRNESMAVFQNNLYVAEGFPTANLAKYDGANWSIVVEGPYPFDPGNTMLASLAVKGRLYVSAGWPAGTIGDQVWGFPLIFSIIGVFRNGAWYLDYDGSGEWDGCGTDLCITFGLAGDVPIVGNWLAASASDEIGVFRNGKWYTDSNGSETWDGCGSDGCGTFGKTGDIPVVGDFNGDGIEDIGIFRGGKWYIDTNNNAAWDGCGTDLCITFGMAGDVPIVGNWLAASASDEIGVFRNGKWYTDSNGSETWDGCGNDGCGIFGKTGDIL